MFNNIDNSISIIIDNIIVCSLVWKKSIIIDIDNIIELHLVSKKSITIDIDNIIDHMYQKNKKIQSKKNTKSHKNIINIIDLHAYLLNHV